MAKLVKIDRGIFYSFFYLLILYTVHLISIWKRFIQAFWIILFHFNDTYIYCIGVFIEHMGLLKKDQSKKEKTSRLTTISISRDNRSILKRMGQTSDSFNDVLTRLLKNNSALESTSRVGTRDQQTLNVSSYTF